LFGARRNKLARMLNVGRREFVVTSLTTGFALATHPVRAEAIKTDAAGLQEGQVDIGGMPAYRAVKEGKDKLPVVLVVQEIFGVHEYIKDVCRRFAKAGYFAVAPSLYARYGDVSQMTDIGQILKDVVSKVTDESVNKDLDATVAWAGKSGRADVAKLGITGFCWGGRVVWMYSAHNPKVKAGAAWYGRLSGPPNSHTPRHPVDVASELKTPVLGLYADHDQGIPVAHVDLMKRELASGKSGSEIVVYPDSQHGFHADYRGSYKKEAAEDGWKRLMDWFKKNGV
jgi:carboxymethylenebutenolidase